MTLLERALDQLPGGPPGRPADLDAALVQLGARVVYVRTDHLFDGATDVSTSKPVIELAWVDLTRSRSPLPHQQTAPWRPSGGRRGRLPHHYDARTRFTLAHEIGHVLLHRLSRTTSLPRLDHQSTERLCNSIAAELLMPKRWFRRLACEYIGIELVQQVAVAAGVSTTAATFRARDLGIGMVAAYFRREAHGWGEPVWRGTARSRIPMLAAHSWLLLEQIPVDTVRDGELAIRCSGHEHLFLGCVQVSDRSALGVFTHVDGRLFSGNVLWRCSKIR